MEYIDNQIAEARADIPAVLRQMNMVIADHIATPAVVDASRVTSEQDRYQNALGAYNEALGAADALYATQHSEPRNRILLEREMYKERAATLYTEYINAPVGLKDEALRKYSEHMNNAPQEEPSTLYSKLGIVKILPKNRG